MIEALQHFHLADAADVAIVATGLYATLSWLRRSQAALVAVGFALIGALYLGARFFGLGLTAWALNGFFAALALVLVVVFQDELRQALEELAAWALGRRADHRPRLDSTEILVRALCRLAEARVGALVVIPGMQKLDRQLRGGTALGGALSESLLQSLFDPHSPGHDGAVVLEDRRVARFGVQLPLSRNVERLADVGTRHSAALGLAERSDALCVVVSEERGTLAVARDGKLESVPDARSLAGQLNRFYRARRALAAPEPRLGRVFRVRRGEKLTSLVLAFALWLLLAHTTARAPEPSALAATPPVGVGEKR